MISGFLFMHSCILHCSLPVRRKRDEETLENPSTGFPEKAGWVHPPTGKTLWGERSCPCRESFGIAQYIIMKSNELWALEKS